MSLFELNVKKAGYLLISKCVICR